MTEFRRVTDDFSVSPQIAPEDMAADTGQYAWHFQETPEDRWDFDSNAQITVAELEIGGKKRRVALHAPKNGYFYVLDRATGQPVGVASYLRIDPAAGSIEVGHINFSPLAQRTSVATDAMFLMMRHAFSLGYRRYEWKCDALNAPSRVAAERLGFTYEGLFRQATIYKGRSRDTAWYSILDREFPAIARAFTAWLAATNFDASGRQVRRLPELLRETRHA